MSLPTDLFEYARQKGVPDAKLGVQPDPDEPERPDLGLETLADYLAIEFPAESWRVEGLVPKEGFGVILGNPKSGKSLFQLQLGLCVAAGLSFLDREAHKCPVLVVEEEGSRKSFQDRLRKQMAGLNVPANIPLHLLVRKNASISNEDWLEQLSDAIAEHHIGLVIIGPLSKVGNLDDENDNAQLNKLLKKLDRVATERGVCILLTHHRRKAATGDRKGAPSTEQFFESARGAGSLVAGVDVALGIDREPDNPMGWLRIMLRDGEAGKEHLVLDQDSLTFSAQPYESAADKQARNMRETAIETIRELGTASNGQIKARLGISDKSCANLLEQLCEEGIIFLHGKRGQGGARLYSLVDAPPDWAGEAAA